MNKLLIFLILIFSFVSNVYAKEYSLECKKGDLVKQNNNKSIIFNFFKEKDLIYVNDIAKINGQNFAIYKKRKFLVNLDKKNHLEWIAVKGSSEQAYITQFLYFINTDTLLLRGSGMFDEHFQKIKKDNNLLKANIIDRSTFFKSKQEIFNWYLDIILQDGLVMQLSDCKGTILDNL